MKRFVAVLSGLLVLPAFAEVAPIYYDELIEYSDDEVSDADVVTEDVATVVVPVAQPSTLNPRNSGRNASRAVPATTATNVTTRAAGNRAVASTRTTSNAAVQSRSATRDTMPRVSSRATRSVTNGANQIATTRRAMQSNTPAVTARASITQTDTVNTPLYTGRVGTRSGAVRARIPTITSVSASTATTETEPVTAQSMDELAQITDFCKAQYTACMDNFCNVLDDNQGRCSCSKNIKNYAKTEEALKEATEALQDVAQQIQYIGLSGDEIETLFTQTEAEMQMQSTQDNTQLKNDLDRIKNLIVDVKSGTASSTYDSGLNFDLSGLLDFSIDSTGFDLNSLFGNTTADTASISNQRGEQLYKTATTRCKASVLNDCAAQGVDISVITNSYDLEIDKQCIAYERSLTETNEEMAQTVRNAKGVLQRARLMVAQQKNAYDLRGCVNALDACMQDDYVCGTDYEYCLDPTGKYIVDGEIVVGSTPGFAYASDKAALSDKAQQYSNNTLFAAWTYSKPSSDNICTQTASDASNASKACNAWGSTSDYGTLAEYINTTVGTAVTDVPSDGNMSEFLQYKIGYIDDKGKAHGMCASVLNKCQDYTYNNKAYNPKNMVITEYLQRTLTKIKVAQDAVLADYAESCISDVASCLLTNNYDAASTKQNIAINACRSQILTCMSVNGDTTATPSPTQMTTWVSDMLNEDTSLVLVSNCITSGGTYGNDKCTCSSGTTWNNTSGKCETTSSS